MELTDRQKQLLKSIIELYVKTGEPVGSELVEKSYDLGVSPATIRNEMVKLTELGYLKQPHTSAGRAPTSIGFRLYISELMKEKDMPVLDEVTMKQKLMEKRAEYNGMVKAATKTLANKCGMLALAMDDASGDIYYAGAANILDIPEFFDIDVTRFVLSMFDEFPTLKQIIGKAQVDPIHVIFGDETGYEHLRPTGFAFARFAEGSPNAGVIGILGPARMNFPVVIPYVRYMAKLLTEAGGVVYG
jgi:heat-inducible transcriptional repressor